MAIPPQFLKNVKGKEKEGKAEPGDSPKEDAAEGDTPKKKSNKKHPHSNAKRAALLAQLRGGK